MECKIGKLLYCGGFGKIYECKIQGIDEECCIKISHFKKETTVAKEMNINSELAKYDGSEKFLCLPIKMGHLNITEYFLIMNRLKPLNLIKIPEIINCLEFMHTIGFCHGDIKFSNVVQDEQQLKLIDFGFTRRPMPIKTSICGTLKYMSLSAHRGYIAYRNDLESLMYSVLELFNTLPWSQLCDNTNFVKQIYEKKSLFKILILNKDSKTLNRYKMDKYEQLYIFCTIIYLDKIIDYKKLQECLNFLTDKNVRNDFCEYSMKKFKNKKNANNTLNCCS